MDKDSARERTIPAAAFGLDDDAPTERAIPAAAFGLDEDEKGAHTMSTLRAAFGLDEEPPQ